MMTEQDALRILQQMVSAINHKDLDSLVGCFHPDYESVQPVHPERSFRGRHRLAENWGWVFERFDEFSATVLDFAVRENVIWTEWVWEANSPDADSVVVRGVMIFTVSEGCFRTGRLYLEPIRS
jgi:hypothetical protein